MKPSTSNTDLVLATFNLTQEQVEWVEREAERRVANSPGTKPNRSEVMRIVVGLAMRESDTEPQELAS